MEGFSYTYNASQNQEVQRIRNRYLPRELSPMEQLKELDVQVRRPADRFAYIYGSVSAIIMGAGMSLVMTDMGDALGIVEPMVPGILIGVVGMLLALTTYKLHQGILNKRKVKYAPEILKLSEQIMRG